MNCEEVKAFVNISEDMAIALIFTFIQDVDMYIVNLFKFTLLCFVSI